MARRPWELLGRPLGAHQDLIAGAASGSPPGWAPLLHLLGGDGAPERLRVLALVVAAAAVVPAFLLGRLALPRRPLLGGLIAGLVVALAPAMLARPDLRHGVAEGFAAVLLVLLAARLEERFTTRRFVALAAAGVGCVLLAHTAVIVLAGLVLALALVAAHAAEWRRALQLLAVGAVAGAVAGALYAGAGGAAVAMPPEPATVPVGDGAGYAGAVVAQRTMLELGRAGFGPWPLAAPAVALGIIALWRARLRAAALAVPATWLGLLVAGLTGRYPFLEDTESLRWSVRTSVGLSTLLTMTAAVGVTWVVLLLLKRSNLRGAVMIAVSAAGVFASAVWDAGLPTP